MTGPTTLAELIQACGRLPQVVASPPTPEADQPPPTQLPGWTVTTTNMSETAVFDKVVMFGVDPAVIWPGSIVQGAHILDQAPAVVPLARAPLTLTLDGLSGLTGGQRSTAVSAPAEATISAAIDSMLPSSGTTVADLDYYVNQVYSADQATASAGINVHYLSGQAKVEMSASFQQNQASFVANVTQKYYTISASAPGPASPYFDPSVTVDEAKGYMGPGDPTGIPPSIPNPPLYIESVDYGRRLLLFMLCDKREQDFSASVQATYSFVAGAASGNGSVQTTDLTSNSTIHLFDIGGSTLAVTKLLTANPGDSSAVSAIAAYIAAGANWTPTSPGAVIGWTYKYLVDDTAVITADTLTYGQQSFASQSEGKTFQQYFSDSGNTDQDGVFPWTIKPDPGFKIDTSSVQKSWTKDPANGNSRSFIVDDKNTPGAQPPQIGEDGVTLYIFCEKADLGLFGHHSGAGTAHLSFTQVGA